MLNPLARINIHAFFLSMALINTVLLVLAAIPKLVALTVAAAGALGYKVGKSRVKKP